MAVLGKLLVFDELPDNIARSVEHFLERAALVNSKNDKVLGFRTESDSVSLCHFDLDIPLALILGCTVMAFRRRFRELDAIALSRVNLVDTFEQMTVERKVAIVLAVIGFETIDDGVRFANGLT